MALISTRQMLHAVYSLLLLFGGSHVPPSETKKAIVEHIGLTQNPKIWGAILAALSPDQKNPCPSPSPSPSPTPQPSPNPPPPTDIHTDSVSITNDEAQDETSQAETIVQPGEDPTQTEVGENYDLKIGGINYRHG